MNDLKIKITLDDTDLKKQLNDLEKQLERIILKKSELGVWYEAEALPIKLESEVKELGGRIVGDEIMQYKEITIEKLTEIQVYKDDALILKADRLLRDTDYENIEKQISDKIGCKVAIIPCGFDTVAMLNKLKDN